MNAEALLLGAGGGSNSIVDGASLPHLKPFREMKGREESFAFPEQLEVRRKGKGDSSLKDIEQEAPKLLIVFFFI